MTIRRFAPTRPLAVIADERQHLPAQLCWRGRWERVTVITEAWELTEGWWQGEGEIVRRQYFRLLMHSGLLCVIYQDHISGRWYLEQIID